MGYSGTAKRCQTSSQQGNLSSVKYCVFTLGGDEFVIPLYPFVRS